MSGGSPLPRSRSDFGYVGLSNAREKRFSLLLPPPFTAPSGYSRLAETPVTLQPRSPGFSEALSPPKPVLKSPTEPHSQKPKSPKPFPKSPSLDHRCNGHHRPFPRSPTLDPKLPRHSISPTLEPRRVRKSPTLDSARALRYSPLLNQTLISRSPTLDPGVLSRGGGEEVVRSQSLRSLRRSPLKMRGSESAQSDVTCPIHRPFPLCEEEDIRRLRNFSVTSKGGLINWGDSFRSHSLSSFPTDTRWPPVALATSTSEQWTSSTSTKTPQRFKVAILGVDEVGKTSLIRQFQTSEYICAFDTSYDINKDYAITVILNKEESELEFIEYRLPDEEEAEVCDAEVPAADAHVVVYSVTSRRSFCRALDLLARVRRLFRRSALVLVGNKSDLVRVRAVTTDEGESSAGEGVVFVETSTAINHQVDELLVSILSRIRAKSRANEAPRPSLARAIKRFLKKACFHAKSASADNLQRL